MPNLSLVIITLLILIIGLLAALAFKLRRWMWDVHRDAISLRNEIRRYHQGTNEKVIAAITETKMENINATCLAPLRLEFPVFLGGPSIDSFHARQLIQELVVREPRTILELGSGSSTVLIARVLQLMGIDGVYHVSVDHDAFFLNVSKRYAELNGVAERIKFVHCPLTMIEAIGMTWYSDIEQTLEGKKIDLLIVDGPPAYEVGQGRARFPALPLLYPHLSKQCTIILDDANRAGETAIIKEWLQSYPEFRLNHLKEGKGVAVLSR